MSKVKAFINKYERKRIKYASGKDYWKILCYMSENEYISCQHFITQIIKCFSLNHQKQTIVLMIWNEEGWLYLVGKNYQHYYVE